MSTCELCDSPGGEVLWQDGRCRVIRVGGAEGDAFPGFCRVIWRTHVREMSDLAADDRRHLREVVDATEAVVRATVRPDKINLASLGNVVPHLHWHVIPRWADDSHFPAPIWAAAARPVPARPQPASPLLAQGLAERLGGAR
jgi:diadenosine tetraphosphate (Ap4A) HIT family hydrolase